MPLHFEGEKLSLQDAVDVLSDQANGRLLQNRSQLISAALALETVSFDTISRDLLDAAAGLKLLARGGDLLLDQKGQKRAAHLAMVVAALHWRTQRGYTGRDGVIVFFDRNVQGWVDGLHNPEHWQPGSVAVNELGDSWVATGGNGRNGAKSWVPEWADGQYITTG